MKKCPKCEIDHEKAGTFCSRKCANSRTFSPETELKRSASNKLAFNKLKADQKKHLTDCATRARKKYFGPWSSIEWRICTGCEKEFLASNAKKHFTVCSDFCFIKVKKKNMAGVKSTYNGIEYDSLWEVDMAKWLDLQNIKFIVPSIGIEWADENKKLHQYYPDFYLPEYDIYLDPKNDFVINLQSEKLKKVVNKIALIYGNPNKIKKELLQIIN